MSTDEAMSTTIRFGPHTGKTVADVLELENGRYQLRELQRKASPIRSHDLITAINNVLGATERPCPHCHGTGTITT